MSLDHDFEIGDTVFYWSASDPKNRVKGKIIDLIMGSELCTYEEDTGKEYDEEDDACGYEHDNWYVKVRLEDGEETDWDDEYYWRKVRA